MTVGFHPGSLPTVETTHHIGKPVLPEGATTVDGRMKVIDNQTGRVKYIDAKKPKVKNGETGDMDNA